MKFTIDIDPKDILSVTSADDGRAVISIDSTPNCESIVDVHLTVEEKAGDVIEALMELDE